MFSISNAEIKNFLKIHALDSSGLHALSSALRPVQHKDFETFEQNPWPANGPQDCHQRFNRDQWTGPWLASAATMALNPRKIGRFAHHCGSPKPCYETLHTDY